jgi:hypothetical protein
MACLGPKLIKVLFKFQDGIDKPQKCQNVCYHPTHQQQSDVSILVLYDTNPLPYPQLTVNQWIIVV